MLIWSKIFVFELRLTKFGGLIAMPEGFPKKTKKVGQSSPISGKSGPKFKFRPRISPPPEGFGGQFWHRAIGGLSPYLSSKIGGPNPKRQFWGNFFRNFGVLQLRPPETRKRASGPPFFILPMNY